MLQALLLALLPAAQAANWAVLVAGSSGYENYRHQADVCHAYKVLKENGFQDDKIIVMSYNDVVHHHLNPEPGKLFNAPDPHGPGVDVYAGCKVDYFGDDVNSKNFVAVLLGRTPDGGNGRVLSSSKNDNIFLFYVDHGDSEVLRFPGSDAINASRFQTVLQGMHREQRFGKMLVFVEACKSGSMFDGFTHDLDVMAMTAVPPGEDSLAIYCGKDSVVLGTQLNTCLGDLFTVYWLDFVRRSSHNTTLRTLYTSVSSNVQSTASLHFAQEKTMIYGDKDSMMDLTLAHFFFPSLDSAPLLGETRGEPAPLVVPQTVVNSRRASPHSFPASSFLITQRGPHA